MRPAFGSIHGPGGGSGAQTPRRRARSPSILASLERSCYQVHPVLSTPWDSRPDAKLTPHNQGCKAKAETWPVPACAPLIRGAPEDPEPRISRKAQIVADAGLRTCFHGTCTEGRRDRRPGRIPPRIQDLVQMEVLTLGSNRMRPEAQCEVERKNMSKQRQHRRWGASGLELPWLLPRRSERAAHGSRPAAQPPRGGRGGSSPPFPWL